tara:strand:- start:271 stop:588 length:318 start_codon:yes stop_codon:yes gene_type:complete
MTTTETWKMPVPEIGDVVLFSKDLTGFSDPVVGFVAGEPGSSTISILVFNRTGYSLVHNSCHHKDDPRLNGDHGWDDLGVWDYAPLTKQIKKLTKEANSGRKSTK